MQMMHWQSLFKNGVLSTKGSALRQIHIRRTIFVRMNLPLLARTKTDTVRNGET